jgi:hypothetical protein
MDDVSKKFPASTIAGNLTILGAASNIIISDVAEGKGPTGANHSSSPFLSFAALNNSDQAVLQTLEGYLLPLLPTAPSYIHNIHLKLNIISQCYLELDLPITPGNKGKKSTTILGTSKVDYTFYPNGTVNVEVRCSNHPYRLQTEEDRSRLLGFFGRLQQVLIYTE